MAETVSNVCSISKVALFGGFIGCPISMSGDFQSENSGGFNRKSAVYKKINLVAAQPVITWCIKHSGASGFPNNKAHWVDNTPLLLYNILSFSISRQKFVSWVKNCLVDEEVALKSATFSYTRPLATIGTDQKIIRCFHILELFVNFVLIKR